MTRSLEPEVAAQIKAKGNGVDSSPGLRQEQKRPWYHYLLLWPIVLDVDKEKRNGRLLTTREWAGWAIVGLVIFLAVTFT